MSKRVRKTRHAITAVLIKYVYSHTTLLCGQTVHGYKTLKCVNHNIVTVRPHQLRYHVFSNHLFHFIALYKYIIIFSNVCSNKPKDVTESTFVVLKNYFSGFPNISNEFVLLSSTPKKTNITYLFSALAFHYNLKSKMSLRVHKIKRNFNIVSTHNVFTRC